MENFSSDLPHRNRYPTPESSSIIKHRVEDGQSIAVQIVAQTGELRGAETHWVDSRLAISVLAGKRILIRGFFGAESAVASSICKDKLVTKRILESSGVPTPPGRVVRSVEEAVSFQLDQGAPIVLKPITGNQGKGVSVALSTPDQIRRAYRRAAGRNGALAEADVQGLTEYRCIATPHACLSVVRRLLPWVVGDGKSTIEELIVETNRSRQDIPSTFGRQIPIDGIVVSVLRDQGLSLDSVLPRGNHVTVRNVGGLSSGGVPVEVSDTVDPRVKDVATAAVRAIPGLSWGGVDLMVTEEGEPHVIEINTDADFSGAEFPHFGKPRAVGKSLYELRMADALPAPVRAGASLPSVPPLQRGSDFTLGPSQPEKLSELLVDYLERKGWSVTRHTSRILEAVRHGSDSLWLSACSTTADLAAVRAALRRHATVRRILRASGIKVPRAVLARSRESVYETLNNGGVWVAIPRLDAWDSRRRRLLERPDAQVELLRPVGGQWLLQSSPDGIRFRVFATPEEVLLAISRTQDISEAEMRVAAQAAMGAVAAVPQLRWAAVDVVVPTSYRTEPRALVEGLSQDPELWADSYFVAGTINSVITTVLGHRL